MPLRGILSLRAGQTSASQDDWATVIFPYQGPVSLGGAVQNALRLWNDPLVAVCDAGRGRIIATTDDTAKAALRALVPTVAARLTPVLVYGQTATQWTLVSDPWTYGGGGLANVCLPQLSKRTLAALVDKVLAMDPASGFLLADQADGGVVRVWSDFTGDSRTAMDAVSALGETICAEFLGTFSPLPFEGGQV